MRKFCVRLVVALVVAAVPLAVAVPAQASVPSTYCDGRSYVSLVKTYQYGAQALALRCGTTSWGFIHIRARWNAAFDSEIALTIAQGEKVADVQQDGGSVIFALFDNSCHELFRVIYNGRAYNGNGVSPQGIITAYYITVFTAVRGRTSIPTYPDGPASPARAGYRTDCPVVQTV